MSICRGILRSCTALAGMLVIATSAFAQSAVPDLAQAEQLLRSGKAEDAHRLLAPHEFNFAGNEEFDYLLGVAALESNHPDQATLIFERVLAVNPNHAAARLDMGRAYFALGDMDRARTEFETARQFGPPPAALATIDQYLAAMDKRTRAAGGLRYTAYAEATIGRDYNVNSSTGQSSIFVPLFGTDLTLATTSVRQRDNFYAAGGGVDASYALSDKFSLLAGLDSKQRLNLRFDTFDYRNTDLRTGAQYAGERDTLRLTLGRNDYELDNTSYRRTQNLNGDWRRTLDERTQLTLFGQDARSRYLQSASRSESANLFLYGASGTRVIDQDSRTIAFASVFRGVDVATDSRADGDRRLHGARAGMQRALYGSADWYASASVQKSTYAIENPTFGVNRKDYQYDVAAGVNWPLSPVWLLRPQMTYTRNDSSLTLYDYDRYELSLTFRRNFK